jgi:hypothetical protein
MDGELVRYPQNHGKSVQLKLLPETSRAVDQELDHMAYDLGDKVPKFAAPDREPSAIDLVNEVMHAYFERPRAWRDAFRLSGRESLRRHQRSERPIPFDLDGPTRVKGLPGYAHRRKGRGPE